MSNSMRLLLDKIETNNMMNIITDPRQMQAANLRKKFFQKQIIKKNTNSYKKKVERDYGYTALREYRFQVGLNSFLAALGTSLLIFSVVGLIQRKNQPLSMASFLSYFGYKKLFDMCNVGEDTELGYKRNMVLRECNKILNTEDF